MQHRVKAGLVIPSAGVPIPAEHEAKGAVVERAIEAALRESEASGVSGSAVRPLCWGLVYGSCVMLFCVLIPFPCMCMALTA